MTNEREQFLINNQMNRRIMRRTSNVQRVHFIYSSKYANYIIPFLKYHGIMDSPPLICCNTLARKPDFYNAGTHSFFIADYYLYSYIFDFNYCFSSQNREEYYINVLLKAIIEKLYVSRNINECYALAKYAPDIESYKSESSYRCESIIVPIIEKSDFQEKFIFLHEASHFLWRSSPNTSTFSFPEGVNYNIPVSDTTIDLKQECYCDYLSFSYIFDYSLPSTPAIIYRQISAIVEILHYIFVLQLVDSSSIQSTSYSVLNFHTITDIINFRISCIKQYLISFLQFQGLATQSFTSFFDEVQVAFNGLIHDSLSIFSAVSEVIKENSPDFSSIQTSEKNLYLHEYLKLL